MRKYYVTKRYVDGDEEEGFFVEKIKSNRQDITSKIDNTVQFEDDDDLVDYLAEVFEQDPDDIEVFEEELKVEFSGNEDKSEPDGAGRIKA